MQKLKDMKYWFPSVHGEIFQMKMYRAFRRRQDFSNNVVY